MIDHSKFDSKIFGDFLREVDLLKKIRHPHIVYIMILFNFQKKELDFVDGSDNPRKKLGDYNRIHGK